MPFLEDGTACSEVMEIPKEEIQRAVCATLGTVFAQVLTIEELTKKISAAVPA